MGSSIELKTRDELALMRDAGRIVYEILTALREAVQPGMTTMEFDRLAEDLIYKKGAKPAFKGYLGFPCCLCASVNEEIVHGIPSKKRKLQEGDLFKLDFGVVYKGYYGDSAVTVPVGKVSDEAAKLVEVTRESLYKAIEQMVPGNRVSDIGAAVQGHAEANGFSVVREFVGHGIGRSLHEPPQVPNFKSKEGPDPRLKVGMVLAVEPMVNAGTPDTELLADRWTAVTADRKLSAHFEHTIAITEAGPEILTAA
ncbi:MAG: type I methionyl aminopeptidase [Myxococcales bacterium]